MGYSIKWNADGTYVLRDILYEKPFGGDVPMVEIHLINDRFIAFPETIPDSKFKDGTSETGITHGAKAKTHIFDIESKKVIWSSESYKYYSRIRLEYSPDTVFEKL